MTILKKLCNIIDTINDMLGRIFAFLIFAVMAIIMCEVFLRRIFNKPQIWTTDLITMLFGAYVVLVLAFGLLHKTYVGVDLVVERLSWIKRHWIHFVTSILFQLPFVYYLVPRSLQFFAKSFATMERGQSVWGPILWPFKLSLFVGLTLLMLQVISELIKEFMWLVTYYKNGKQEPEPIASLSMLGSWKEESAQQGKEDTAE